MPETLEKRRLGKSGLELTVVGTGLWAVGGGDWGGAKDDDAYKAIDASLDAGINFYDTADVYGMGHSEEVLGKAMKGRRDRFFVASKIGWIGYDGEANRSQYDTVEKVVAGVEEGLRRMQTDRLELIQYHIHYREANTDIVREGFQRLVRDGKVRAYGISSSNFDFIQDFNSDGQCASLQIDHSILNRTSEGEIFDYCQREDIGVIVRGVLAMGLLTGKFTAETRFPQDDFRHNWHEKADERQIFHDDLAKVERLRPLTASGARTLPQLALRFAIDHPAVTTVIPGARNAAQARENVRAGLQPVLTDEERRAIDAVTPAGGGRKIWPA